MSKHTCCTFLKMGQMVSGLLAVLFCCNHDLCYSIVARLQDSMPSIIIHLLFIDSKIILCLGSWLLAHVFRTPLPPCDPGSMSKVCIFGMMTISWNCAKQNSLEQLPMSLQQN